MSDESVACRACGEVHARSHRGGEPRATCTGHRRRSDPLVACMKFPPPGATVCENHGGNAPQVRAAAQERLREAEARDLARQAVAPTLGSPDAAAQPGEIILREIRWSSGHVEFYRGQVQALDPGALVRGTRGLSRTESRAERTGFEAGTSTSVSTSTDVGPEVHVWLRLYNEERDRLFSWCEKADRLGIDKDVIRLQQQQGARIAEAFGWLHRRAAARFAGSGVAVEAFRDDFIAALRLLSTGAAFPLPEIVA